MVKLTIFLCGKLPLTRCGFTPPGQTRTLKDELTDNRTQLEASTRAYQQSLLTIAARAETIINLERQVADLSEENNELSNLRVQVTRLDTDLKKALRDTEILQEKLASQLQINQVYANMQSLQTSKPDSQVRVVFGH